MKLKVIIDSEIHRVVFIEYCNRLPHSVTTELIYKKEGSGQSHTVLYHWDFFPNNGDNSDMRYYNSGSGGYDSVSLPVIHWADGYTGIYWISSDFHFGGEVKNGKQLKHPIRLSKFGGGYSDNPFNVAWETSNYDHCEDCGKSGDDYCRECIYEDENDNYQLKYKSDNRDYI